MYTYIYIFIYLYNNLILLKLHIADIKCNASRKDISQVLSHMKHGN